MVNNVVVYSILRTGLSTFQVFFISVCVVQYSSLSNWGSFVQVYLAWSLGALLINAGSKDFLIKTISQTPALIWQHVSANTMYRMLLNLAVPLVVLGFFSFTPFVGIGVVVMVLLRTGLSTYEAIIIYQKSFEKAFWADLALLVLICLAVWVGQYMGQLTVAYLVCCFVVFDVIRLLLYEKLLGCIKHITLSYRDIAAQFNVTAPFFISGIIGFLINKSDLYLFNAMIDDPNLIAQYHILNTIFNVLIIVISSMLQIRSKELFRLPFHSLQKLIRVYIRISIVLSIAALLLFYLASPFVFGYQPDLVHLCLIACGVIAFTVYMFYIQFQYRINQGFRVNMIIGISGVMGLLLGVWWIPLYQITGAVSAVLLSNLAVGAGLWWYSRKPIHLTTATVNETAE